MIDREEIKKALKAFRKRLRRTRLDDESRLTHGAMSKGESSAIIGIRLPSEFPREVWEELIQQGKLKSEGYGTYSLVDGSGPTNH